MKLIIPDMTWKRLLRFAKLADPNEVAWVGTLKLENNNFILDEVFCPLQKMRGAKADINEDALMELHTRLLREGKQLRWHGHSHVRMGVSPSGTDREEFLTNVKDAGWFIASIINLKEEAFTQFGHRIDIDGMNPQLLTQELATEIRLPPDDEAWLTQIKAEFEAAKEKEPILGYTRWNDDSGAYGLGLHWKGESVEEWRERLARLREWQEKNEPGKKMPDLTEPVVSAGGAQAQAARAAQQSFFGESAEVQAALEEMQRRQAPMGRGREPTEPDPEQFRSSPKVKGPDHWWKRNRKK